eukprot:172982_1
MAQIMDDKSRISALEIENAALKKKLADYEKLINGAIDNIHEQETANDKQLLKPKEANTTLIDWSLIRSKFQEEDDEAIMQLISKYNINVTDHHDESGDSIWYLACRYGLLNILKLCVNLGVDITKVVSQNGSDAIHVARSYAQDEILEFLLLEKIGAGKANDIVKSCDYMWDEDAVLSSLLSRLNTPQYLHIKEDMVQIITDIISNREPVSSYLINLGMSLDSVKIWRAAKRVIDDIIHDTSDTVGWHYLKTYLLQNNTFLFRKYQLYTNCENDQKDTDSNIKSRKIDELNTKELIYFLIDICVVQYNKEKDQNIMATQCNMIVNTINSERLNGLAFARDYNDLMKLYSFLQSSGIDFDKGWDFATYLNETFMCAEKINALHNVPFIIEDEYGFSTIYDQSNLESTNQAQRDIKHVFENEEKEHQDNWRFLKEYGSDFVSKYGDQRVRQDLLDCGVKSRYSKDQMIGFMRKATSFNGLRFYDSEIYLNQLMLQCAILNDAFQRDVEQMFIDASMPSKAVMFRRGPLKQKERSKIKSETDYCTEAWPQSSCLLDIVRCTVTFEDVETMISGIQLFEKSIKNNTLCVREILRIKNGFINYSHSNPEYVDLKYNVAVHMDGRECVGEVQFLLKDVSKFKVKAHKFYDVIRRKEYFENLKLVSALKNNLDKRLIIYSRKGDHKGIKDIIIKQKIKTLHDLQQLNRLNHSLFCIYHYGHVQCLRAVISVFKGDAERYQLLKRRVSDFGGTGLMLASFHGRFEMAKYILSLYSTKEFIFTRNELGLNAFLWTSCQGHIELAKLILSKLKSEEDVREMVHTKSNKDETCLIQAAKNGHTNIITFVTSMLGEKDKIEMLNMRDHSSRNAFETACVNKRIKTARFMLSQLNDKKEAIRMVNDATEILDKKTINSAVAVSLKTWLQEFS